MKYHPDKNSAAEAEEKFKFYKEAYDVLGDEENRYCVRLGSSKCSLERSTTRTVRAISPKEAVAEAWMLLISSLRSLEVAVVAHRKFYARS